MIQESANTTESVPKKTYHRTLLWSLLAIVIALMLIAGLQPYANYKDNWVSFTPQTNETKFGFYGLTVGELPPFVKEAASAGRLQILITPIIRKPVDTKFHVLAQLDTPGSEVPVIFGQWNTNIIAINGHDRRNQLGYSRINANLSRHVGVPVEILYNFGATETRVELDGRFENSGPPFDFSDPLTRISIGNSPDGIYGWYGSLATFKFMDAANPSNSITYRFDQDEQPTIQADTTLVSDGSLDLNVPDFGGFPDKAWIGTLRFDELLTHNLTDVIVNFLGFAPLGFLLIALLRTGAKRTHWLLASLVTLVLGFLVSFGIEMTQTIIPGRSPHMHDLFLNTTGAFAGGIGFLVLAWVWAKFTRPKVAPDGAADPTATDGSSTSVQDPDEPAQNAELKHNQHSTHIDL